AVAASAVVPLPYGGTFSAVELGGRLAAGGSAPNGLLIYDPATHVLWADDGVAPLALDTIAGFLGPSVLVYVPASRVFVPLTHLAASLQDALAATGGFAVVTSLFGIATTPASAVNDRDGDGVPTGEDCDDTRADVHPGAVERCNGVDDDCDGLVDGA